MPRTPRAPHRRITAYQRFYTQWCKERKEYALPCSLRAAGKIWKKMTEEEKAMYRVQLREASEQPRITGPFYDPFEEEDLINNVVSLNSSPIKQEEQLLVSPFLGDFWPVPGPSTLDELPISGPSTSVFDQSISTGPSPVIHELPLDSSPTDEVPATEPCSSMDQSSFTAFLSAIEESPAAGSSSIPLSAPIPTYPLPACRFLDGTDFSLLDESAYAYLPPTPTPTFASSEGNWWDLFGEVPPTAIPTESDPPTSVPITPATGHSSLALPAPQYTPGLHTQDLPSGLEGGQFAFNGMEAAVPEQPTWNTHDDTGNFQQLSLAPFAPIPPAPVPTFLPPPMVPGQFGQMAGFSDNSCSWDNTARVLGNDQLQVTLPPIHNQNIPFAAVQQSFDAINANFGQGGKPLRLAGVSLWFAPS